MNRCPGSLAALLSVILILSAWMHAGTDHARDLSADIPVLVESGDSRLMVLPRETLEQRSRDTDRSAGGPPEAFDAGSLAGLSSSTYLPVLRVVRHVPPRTADSRGPSRIAARAAHSLPVTLGGHAPLFHSVRIAAAALSALLDDRSCRLSRDQATWAMKRADGPTSSGGQSSPSSSS